MAWLWVLRVPWVLGCSCTKDIVEAPYSRMCHERLNCEKVSSDAKLLSNRRCIHPRIKKQNATVLHTVSHIQRMQCRLSYILRCHHPKIRPQLFPSPLTLFIVDADDLFRQGQVLISPPAKSSVCCSGVRFFRSRTITFRCFYL